MKLERKGKGFSKRDFLTLRLEAISESDVEKLKEKKFEKMRSLKAKTLCENINKCYLSLCRAGALENSLLYKRCRVKENKQLQADI